LAARCKIQKLPNFHKSANSFFDPTGKEIASEKKNLISSAFFNHSLYDNAVVQICPRDYLILLSFNKKYEVFPHLHADQPNALMKFRGS
jgi:hypothetical protein